MKRFFVLTVCFLLAACVTINIYFPAAAAEKAADEIIKSIQTPSQSQRDGVIAPVAVSVHSGAMPWWETVLEWLVPSAHANADLNIDSPEIRQLRHSMQARFPSLLPYYQQGYIGINAQGLLSVVDPGKVPLAERQTINRLLNDENADRERLYRAIAQANGRPDWYDDIKATFAQRWVSHAQPGWFYQQGSSWQRK